MSRSQTANRKAATPRHRGAVPAWMIQDSQEISAKKEKTLDRRLKYNKSDFLTPPESVRQSILESIGQGGTLDQSNVEVLLSREDGKNTYFLLKKLGSIDSVIASDLFRTLTSKKCFAKREVIIYDEENDDYYTAIKFEEDITKKLKKKTRREDLSVKEAETNRFFLGDYNARGQVKEDSFREVREDFLSDKDFMMKNSFMDGLLYVFGEADDNPQNFVTTEDRVPGRIDMGALFNTHIEPFGRLIYSTKPRFRKDLISYLQAGGNANPQASPPHKDYEQATADFLGEDISKTDRFRIYGCAQSSAFFLEQIAGVPLDGRTKDILRIKIADKKKELKIKVPDIMTYPYLETRQGRKPVLKIPQHSWTRKNLEQYSMTYSDVLSQEFVDYFRRNDDAALREYSIEEYKDDLLKILYDAQQKLLDESSHNLDDAQSDILLEEISQANSELKNYLYSQDFQTADECRENFAAAITTASDTLYERLDGCGMFSNQLLGSIDRSYTQLISTVSSQKFTERQANFVLLRKIEDRIKSESEEDPARHDTRDYFVSFMYGIERAIELSQDEEFLQNYAQKYQDELGEYGHAIALKGVDFLKQNAAQAQNQFAIFLDYYHRIKSQVTEFSQKKEDAVWRKKGGKIKEHVLEKELKDDFSDGSKIRLKASFLKDTFESYKSTLEKVATEPNSKEFFYTLPNGKTQKRYYQVSSQSQSGLEESLVCLPSKITDIYLQKAQPFDDADAISELMSSRPRAEAMTNFSADNFVEDALFSQHEIDEESAEIHVNFGDRLNYGGNVFSVVGGNNELKTRRSVSSTLLSYLHQHKKNSSRGEFLDLRLGDYNLYDERGNIGVGRPILIEGQHFLAQNGDIALDQLDVAFPRVDKKMLLDQKTTQDIAKHIFLTAYKGFELCKKSKPEKKRVIVKSSFDKDCGSPAFIQLSMQILAAKTAGVELKITNKFLVASSQLYEREISQGEIDYFKRNVLPNIADILSDNNLSINQRIAEIHNRCQEFEMLFKRDKSGITSANYREIKGQIVSIVKADKPALANAKLKFEEIAQILQNPQISGVANQDGRSTPTMTKSRIPFFSRQQKRAAEARLIDRLKDRGLITQNITNIAQLRQFYQDELHKSQERNIQYQAQDTSDFRLRETGNVKEITVQLPQTAVAPLGSVSLVNISTTKPQSQIWREYQEKIKEVIEKVALDEPQERQQLAYIKIVVLMKSLARYGKEHLKEIDAKDLDSILQGGENAGFSRWKNEQGFRNILQEEAKKQGIKIDVSSEQSAGIKEFARFSALLQIKSQNIFAATSGKHYKFDNVAIKSVARSWRMAIIADENNIKVDRSALVR